METFLYRYFLDNPIATAEQTHLHRVAIAARHWWGWLFRRVVWLGIGLSLVHYFGYFWIVLTNPLEIDQSPVFKFMDTFSGFLLLPWFGIVIGWYFLLMAQTLGQASRSITREKMSNTWDLLVLTGFGPARFVWGKWWGVVRRQLSAYIRLFLLSLGGVSWLSVGWNIGYVYHYASMRGETYLTTDFPHPLMVLFVCR